MREACLERETGLEPADPLLGEAGDQPPALASVASKRCGGAEGGRAHPPPWPRRRWRSSDGPSPRSSAPAGTARPAPGRGSRSPRWRRCGGSDGDWRGRRPARPGGWKSVPKQVRVHRAAAAASAVRDREEQGTSGDRAAEAVDVVPQALPAGPAPNATTRCLRPLPWRTWMRPVLPVDILGEGEAGGARRSRRPVSRKRRMMARLRQPNSAGGITDRPAAPGSPSSVSGWITFCSTLTFEDPRERVPRRRRPCECTRRRRRGSRGSGGAGCPGRRRCLR